ETEAGDAGDGELHGEDVAGFAARVVGRRRANGGHFAVGKRRGVEPRGVERVLLEPETDGVLRLRVGRGHPSTVKQDAVTAARPDAARASASAISLAPHRRR